MELTNEYLQQRLTEKFEGLTEWSTPYGLLTFTAPTDLNLKILQFLYDDAELGFRFLTDLTAVHYPDRKGEEIAVVYHMHNMRKNVRIRFKVFVPENKPDVFTATRLYETANWMERETYDNFGVNFVGHPNLIRILNVDEMTYFPLLKQYPVEDQTRIDKDDEMFGRGGSYDFGNERDRQTGIGTISEAEKN
jgi:NADH-quinone oxidoreductase subunit C